MSLEKEEKRLWAIIIFVVALNYLTLPFFGELIKFLDKTLGKQLLGAIINSLLALSVLFAFIYFARNGKKKYKEIVLTIAVLAVGVAVAMGYEIPVERLHFLVYGFIGSLIYKATADRWRLPFLSSFALVTGIGGGDETIQWFLPNRVGDIRDVFMNSFGGLLGIAVTSLWHETP